MNIEFIKAKSYVVCSINIYFFLQNNNTITILFSTTIYNNLFLISAY